MAPIDMAKNMDRIARNQNKLMEVSPIFQEKLDELACELAEKANGIGENSAEFQNAYEMAVMLREAFTQINMRIEEIHSATCEIGDPKRYVLAKS
jgi:hypothetical protein